MRTGEPYLLSCALGIIAPWGRSVKDKIGIFSGFFPGRAAEGDYIINIGNVGGKKFCTIYKTFYTHRWKTRWSLGEVRGEIYKIKENFPTLKRGWVT